MRDLGSIVLGGNVFGWTVAKPDAFRLLDAYVDRGGIAIDTADLYSAWGPGNHGGESETILGSWLRERGNRDKVVICTKVAKWSERPGLAPANVRAAVDGSLRRLGTDYIDLYYAHQDDPDVPQEDYVAVFDELVRAGKVRTLGASNFTPERLGSAIAIARAGALARFEVSQDHYNLVERGLEQSLLPVLRREAVIELPYWALAKGFLTGKYRPGAPVDSARAGAAGAYLAQHAALLPVLDELAAAHRVSVAAIALAWLRAQPGIGAPIASARTVEQLAPLFEVATLSADELARLG
jgi:aryl-alcohol dehydrogenase-like predicted oxidoreductase